MPGFPLDHEPKGEMLDMLDARAGEVRQLMEESSQADIAGLWKQIDLSAIYHDCALEGQVVGPEELDAAFDSHKVADAATLPLFSLLRSHRQALDLGRDLAGRRRLVFSVDVFRTFHALFSSEPDEGKNVRYRRDIPLHRAYFHEICEPKKIPQAMRGLISWLNNPEDHAGQHPIIRASRFHFHYMRIFPFHETSGKVGRTMTNTILIRHGYLPAIIHATERQRYYEALRQSHQSLTDLLLDSELASLDAAVRYLSRREQDD